MSLLVLFNWPGIRKIAATDILQLPVDAQLAGHPPPIKMYGATFEGPPPERKERVRTSATGVRRLSGPKPSFTVTTNSKGYS